MRAFGDLAREQVSRPVDAKRYLDEAFIAVAARRECLGPFDAVDHLKAPVGDRGRGVLFGDAGSGAGSRAAAVIDRHRRMPLEQPRSKKAESGQRGARTRIGNLQRYCRVNSTSEFDNPKGLPLTTNGAPLAWRAVQKSMQPRPASTASPPLR